MIKARILDPIIKVKLHKYIAEHATAEAKHNHLVQQQEKGLVPMNVVSPLLELDWREGVATLTILKVCTTFTLPLHYFMLYWLLIFILFHINFP